MKDAESFHLYSFIRGVQNEVEVDFAVSSFSFLAASG